MNISSIKLSIIFPVYNVAPYVEESLRSVLDQNYDNMEILIIDDCGSDDSMDIIQRLLSSHPNGNKAKVIRHEYNKGIAAGRNTGIKAAKGEWLMFVDSDDLLAPGACSTLMANTKDKYDLIVANRNIIEYGTNRQLHDPSTRKPNSVEMFTYSDYERYSLQGEAYNKLLKRSFVIKHNLFFEEGILFEDTLWASQLKIFLPKTLYIPNVIYIYRLRPGSTMTTYREHHLKSRIKATFSANKFALSHLCLGEWRVIEIYEQFRNAACRDMILMTHDSIKNYFKLCRLFREVSPCGIREYLGSPVCFMKKIRYINHLVPILGDAINLLIFYIQNYKNKSTSNGTKLRLSPHFFHQLD